MSQIIFFQTIIDTTQESSHNEKSLDCRNGNHKYVFISIYSNINKCDYHIITDIGPVGEFSEDTFAHCVLSKPWFLVPGKTGGLPADWQ